ncbi:hypothetical protein DFA_09067 [Cavenderia fasciculata]|uniref:Uncharacterized protein n=1 Tax=Cavenderia fasciculata TaxID=261658 RepID=F4Q6L3_CACFS|nr:uncharacterized protein DFA_09067 [Cavenderia fasciculata]EGG16523.1 hypothetical protein DFA_09067 [Cavenderia fasciculata]|eukprot:XP_004354923.1 hypothetical protein DFA_09067 [Cavenderia fasciculata]
MPLFLPGFIKTQILKNIGVIPGQDPKRKRRILCCFGQATNRRCQHLNYR